MNWTITLSCNTKRFQRIGFNWKNTDSSTWNEKTTETVKQEVPPKKKVLFKSARIYVENLVRQQVDKFSVKKKKSFKITLFYTCTVYDSIHFY